MGSNEKFQPFQSTTAMGSSEKFQPFQSTPNEKFQPFQSTTTRASNEKFQPSSFNETNATAGATGGRAAVIGGLENQSEALSSQKTPFQPETPPGGIQNLMLGDSQPFQAGLVLNASRHQPANLSDRSLYKDPLTPSPVVNDISSSRLNGVESKPAPPTHRSSLFNLTGGQMTKTSTNLSVQGRREDSPITQRSSALLPDGKGTDPLDLMNKLGFTSPQKKEGVSKSSSRSSIGSLRSWPDTIQNLHAGKPAYSTGTDPFGSKHVAAINRQSIEGETRASNGFQPTHGRRAVPTNLGSISENHPGSDLHQLKNINPRDNQSYPWEVSIDLQAQKKEYDGVVRRKSSDRTNSASTRASLLPLRTKQNSGIGAVPESAQYSGLAEPEDLEEVIL
jgi:hypothetical protein